MSGGPLEGTEGMSDARQAFEAVLDAEAPSRSRKDKQSDEPSRMDMNDLFPEREMDRSEPEGGEFEDDPEPVKQARSRAGKRAVQPERQQRQPPRDPTEGDDEDEDGDEGVEEEGEEPDQQEEDEEQEDSASPIDLDQVVEVTVDGQPHQVSLKEALGGYIRTETFHRRLGELQQGVEALQGRQQEMTNYQSMFVDRANALEEYVTAFMPKEPDWEALYSRDPNEFVHTKHRWDNFMKQVEGLRETRERTRQELADSQARALHHFAAVNRTEMLRRHPEWKDEKVWKRDHESMRKTARAVGYSDAEIDQLYDARGVDILNKAAKYDKLMATKPRPVRNGYFAPKKTGVTPQRGNMSRSFDRAERRLSRTGSLQDAARVFESILDRER